MSEGLPEGALPVGTRVTFPYGGSRRTGTISDVSAMPDPNGSGSNTTAYLIDVGPRKVFVQGAGVVPAGEGPPQGFDAVAEGVAYGRRRPRNQRRR
ncbi:MAG TPA: hypothetical protein VN193_13880 [Candidatus Angelobacter sp.]|jgi:hypothetical protein|nr:hypothetical protein [Candidatus Angelobacter sp.]